MAVERFCIAEWREDSTSYSRSDEVDLNHNRNRAFITDGHWSRLWEHYSKFIIDTTLHY